MGLRQRQFKCVFGAIPRLQDDGGGRSESVLDVLRRRRCLPASVLGPPRAPFRRLAASWRGEGIGGSFRSCVS